MLLFPQFENQDSVKDAPACIEAIFPQGGEVLEDKRDFLTIYPGYVQVTTYKPVDRYPVAMPNMEKQYCNRLYSQTIPVIQNCRRGLITSFSRKARSRMIKKMHSLDVMPNCWQDFTFPDEVFENVSIGDESKVSSEILEKFKRRLEKMFPALWGIWRRDWQDRKSGIYKGRLLPHFHCLFYIPGIAEKDFKNICIKIALLWVDCLPIKEKINALKVSLSPESYRWINSPKMASCYVSKYVAKEENHEKGKVSLGRFWGVIGNPPFVNPKTVRLYRSEMDMLKRIFRRRVKGSSTRLYNTFRQREFSSWLLIPESSLNKVIVYIKSNLPPIPF